MFQFPTPFNGISYKENPQPFPFMFPPFPFSFFQNQAPQCVDNFQNHDKEKINKLKDDRKKNEKNEDNSKSTNECKKEREGEKDNNTEEFKEQMTYVYKAENTQNEILFSKVFCSPFLIGF